MIVAEVCVSSAAGIMQGGFVHRVQFSSVAEARVTYESVLRLLERKAQRKNDLPAMIELCGVGTRLAIPLDHAHSVEFVDFAALNEENAGAKEVFPHVFTTQRT